MNKDAPDESHLALSAMAASSDSLASVFVFNCTVLSLTVLSVNEINVAPQGIAGIAGSGSPPSCLAISRNIFGSSALTKVTFEGFTQPSWSETISIRQLPMINMYLWCYLNGFMLVDQYGTINYMYGQSSSAAMVSGLDEWPETGRVISKAL